MGDMDPSLQSICTDPDSSNLPLISSSPARFASQTRSTMKSLGKLKKLSTPATFHIVVWT